MIIIGGKSFRPKISFYLAGLSQVHNRAFLGLRADVGITLGVPLRQIIQGVFDLLVREDQEQMATTHTKPLISCS